jgi:hypothetical protein
MRVKKCEREPRRVRQIFSQLGLLLYIYVSWMHERIKKKVICNLSSTLIFNLTYALVVRQKPWHHRYPNPSTSSRTKGLLPSTPRLLTGWCSVNSRNNLVGICYYSCRKLKMFSANYHIKTNRALSVTSSISKFRAHYHSKQVTHCKLWPSLSQNIFIYKSTVSLCFC